MTAEKPIGQVSYEARHVAKGRRMGADEGTPDSEVLTVIALAYDELPAGMQADEEAGAQAVLKDALAEAERLRAELAEVTGYWDDLTGEILSNAGDEYDGDEAAPAIAVRYVRDLEAVAGRNAAGLRAAIAIALTGMDIEVLDGDRVFSTVAADPGEVADAVTGEIGGARAALDNRTPWGDANITTLAMGDRCAVVSSGTDGDVIKVIGYGETGLEYFESYDEWKRANPDAPGLLCGHRASQGGTAYSCERPPHPVDGYGYQFRHAAGIDAEFARRHADDERGEPDLVTWGEDEQGGDQEWEVAWGTVAGYAAGGDQ